MEFPGHKIKGNLLTGWNDFTAMGLADGLFDFSKTTSLPNSPASAALIDTSGDPAAFGGDGFRATRCYDPDPQPPHPCTNGHIVWKQYDATGFIATVFAHESDAAGVSQVKLEAAYDDPENAPPTFSVVNPTISGPFGASAWRRYEMTISGLVNAKYLRFSWNQYPTWTPQLGTFRIDFAEHASVGSNLAPPTPPGFVDAAAANFTLAAGSDAINKVDPSEIGEVLAESCVEGLADQGAYESSTTGACEQWAAGCNGGGCFGFAIDDLRDWSRTHSHSASLSLTPAAGLTFVDDGVILGDESRVAASTAGSQEIVWKRSALDSFSFMMFFRTTAAQPSISASISNSGSAWTTVPMSVRTLPATGAWIPRIYTVFDFGGSTYVRLSWQQTDMSDPRSPQLASVNMTNVEWSGRELDDPLADMSKLFASLSSSNLYNDPTPIGGDTGHIFRNSTAPGHTAVWKHPNMHSFIATAYFYTLPIAPHVNPPDPSAFGVEVSFDGLIWRQADASVVTTTIPGHPVWQKQVYFVDRLTNVNFARLVWPASQANWAPQIGAVRIVH